MQYTGINTILSKFHRETQNEGVNESYLISMTGEALEFLRVHDNQEQAVAFLEVKDYQAILPEYLTSILQVARDVNWVSPEQIQTANLKPSCSPQAFLEQFGECCAEEPVVPPVTSNCPPTTFPLTDCLVTDCQGNIIGDAEKVYYRPYFDLKWEYQFWYQSGYYRQNFIPVRLANHTFFNSVVAREKMDVPYGMDCNSYGISDANEYTIVGKADRELRFSFKDGRVAVAYTRTVIDEETGLPCVPDDISSISAITYYIKWKLAETDFDTNTDGSAGRMQYYEKHWLKYVRQAKNKAKMPQSIDTYQNLLEQTHYLIPRHRRYYGFFGKLGREEGRPFNDPDFRNKLTTTGRHGRT